MSGSKSGSGQKDKGTKPAGGTQSGLHAQRDGQGKAAGRNTAATLAAQAGQQDKRGAGQTPGKQTGKR